MVNKAWRRFVLLSKPLRVWSECNTQNEDSSIRNYNQLDHNYSHISSQQGAVLLYTSYRPMLSRFFFSISNTSTANRPHIVPRAHLTKALQRVPSPLSLTFRLQTHKPHESSITFNSIRFV